MYKNEVKKKIEDDVITKKKERAIFTATLFDFKKGD